MLTNLSIFLKKKFSVILTVTSLCLTSLLFLNADKLIFEIESNNISIANLISTRVGLLILAFFGISLIMYILNTFKIKQFSQNFVEQYVSWFFISISAALNWILYRFSIDLYTTLKQNLHIDTLYKGLFVTVKRIWNKNELLSILNDELLKYKDIVFSNEEKATLINKAGTSVESLIREMQILCEIKHNELLLSQVQEPKSMLYRAIDYASTHPAEVVLASLTIILICVGVQNYFFQTDTDSTITHLLDEVNRLRGEINHVGALRETLNIISSQPPIGGYEHLCSRLDDIYNEISELSGSNTNNTTAIGIILRILQEANLLPAGLSVPRARNSPNLFNSSEAID